MGTNFHNRSLSDALVVVKVTDQRADIWSELRPKLIAGVLRDMADELEQNHDIEPPRIGGLA
jgi:hypothetical protein